MDKKRFFPFLYEVRKALLRQGYGGASPACPAVALAKEDEAARNQRFYLGISHILCLCLIQGRVVKLTSIPIGGRAAEAHGRGPQVLVDYLGIQAQLRPIDLH